MNKPPLLPPSGLKGYSKVPGEFPSDVTNLTNLKIMERAGIRNSLNK